MWSRGAELASAEVHLVPRTPGSVAWEPLVLASTEQPRGALRRGARGARSRALDGRAPVLRAGALRERTRGVRVPALQRARGGLARARSGRDCVVRRGRTARAGLRVHAAAVAAARVPGVSERAPRVELAAARGSRWRCARRATCPSDSLRCRCGPGSCAWTSRRGCAARSTARARSSWSYSRRRSASRTRPWWRGAPCRRAPRPRCCRRSTSAWWAHACYGPPRGC
jgi:hypothetical protein